MRLDIWLCAKQRIPRTVAGFSAWNPGPEATKVAVFRLLKIQANGWKDSAKSHEVCPCLVKSSGTTGKRYTRQCHAKISSLRAYCSTCLLPLSIHLKTCVAQAYTSARCCWPTQMLQESDEQQSVPIFGHVFTHQHAWKTRDAGGKLGWLRAAESGRTQYRSHGYVSSGKRKRLQGAGRAHQSF